MRHLKVPAFLVSIFILLGSTNTGHSAVKITAGGKCAKAGITAVQSGKRYTCVKVGKGLQWNSGLTAPAKPIPGQSTQPQTTVPEVSPTPPVLPRVSSRVAMRIQAPTIEKNTNGTPKNYVDFSTSSRSSDWAVYYGPDLNTYLRNFPAGETFTITWKVTDVEFGTPLANEKVWLLVNGNSAGRQFATFSYSSEGKSLLVPPNNNSSNGETQIEGVTDSKGLVTFTLRNLNFGTTADTCCSTEIPNPDFMNAFSNISLTTKRDYKNESRDFLWADFVNTPGGSGPEFKLIWSDEFSGSSGAQIDSKFWTSRYCGQSPSNGGGTCYNNESQYYTPTAVALDGTPQGNAVISTTRISNKPSNAGACLNPLNNCSFTSARFDSQGKVSFLYGKIEARIKMPAGAGNWPAFWALGTNITSVGWPVSGEIDIAEQWRFQPNRNSGAIHYSTGALGCCSNHTFDMRDINGVDYSTGFHSYSMTWLPGSITFAVDGVTFFTKNSASVRTKLWPFDEPIFLILNNAISDLSSDYNKWDGWVNSAMTIDYVRAYSINGIGSVTFP